MPLKTELQILSESASIQLQGELDSQTAPELQTVVDQAIAQQVKGIVFHADTLDFVSSAGLRIFLLAARQFPGRILLVGARPAIKESVVLVGLNHLIKIEDTVEKIATPDNSVRSKLSTQATISLPPLVAAGVLSSIGSIREYANDAARKAGLDKMPAYWLCLAVDEIATNVIVHGYEPSGLVGSIKLSGEITPKTLTISMEDTAPPYDPRQREEPEQLGLPLEEREIGGLGVYLALTNIDSFDYQITDNCNYNIFVMKRTS